MTFKDMAFKLLTTKKVNIEKIRRRRERQRRLREARKKITNQFEFLVVCSPFHSPPTDDEEHPKYLEKKNLPSSLLTPGPTTKVMRRHPSFPYEDDEPIKFQTAAVTVERHHFVGKIQERVNVVHVRSRHADYCI